MDFPRMQKSLAQASASYRLSLSQVRAERGTLEEARERLQNALQARKIIQEAAEATQKAVHARIAGTVSRCLRAVFGEEAYELQLEFVQKRGKTEAELSLRRGDLILDDPQDSAGGGVVDVCAFALRLAALMLSQPRRRKLLLLDEPFKHLSAEYRPQVRELLELLHAETGVSFLLVTHSPELVVGKEITLPLK